MPISTANQNIVTTAATAAERVSSRSFWSNEFDGLGTAAASGFAHKLRNSLSIIVSGSEQLTEFARDIHNDDAAELSAVVMEAALMQEQLITRFLQAFGMNNLDHQAADIGSILQAAVNDSKIRVPHSRIDCQGIDSVKDLAVDCALLQRAISELLTNAIEGSPDQRATMRVARSSDTVRIVIENTVANRFDQNGVLPAEPFRSSKSGHGGLGLSIAGRSICDLGGSITMRENSDRIEFTVTIPVEKIIRTTASIERNF